MTADGFDPGAHVPVVIIGAGAAGLCAALAATEAGAEVVVIERDPVPRGSTSLSAGLVPAAGTRFQAARGVADDAGRFAADIQKKARHRADPAVVAAVATGAAPAIEWLADRHGLDFSVVHDFDYPGHSARRMHGLASRSGLDLVDHLRAAAERAGVTIMTGTRAASLIADHDGRIRGIETQSGEKIGCDALVLACCGYGGDAALVAEHIPSLAGGLYFGHPGNQGDAVRWGRALGAALRDMTGHQGHGSVAHPAAILVTWAVITEGGFQVNQSGARFWDESQGYSEAAEAVLAQPGGIAFDIFDARIAAIARQFEDFRAAEAAGAILAADTPEALAARLNLPGLAATMAAVDADKARGASDAFGRDWSGRAPLAPPFHAVRVTGALFHTQGGLAVDGAARVLRPDGTAFPNLFAAGGAACGVSGPEAGGYLSGNGLLTAVVLGRIAGQEAASGAAA